MAQRPSELELQRGLRVLAERAAQAGGQIALRMQADDLSVELKADASEVSQADLAAQALIIQIIRSERPHDLVIGEEQISPEAGGADWAAQRKDFAKKAALASLAAPPSAVGQSSSASSASAAGPRVAWIIDPIDGTRNYLRGTPLWCCSVGALLDGVPLAGAIQHAAANELFSASRGEGLFINGVRAARLDDSSRAARCRAPQLLTALPSVSDGALRRVVDLWISQTVVRGLGSTALHLAYVAAGRIDATLITDSKLWDVVAGWAMIEANGGVCVPVAGGPRFPIDLSAYAGAATPCLAARDAQVLARLRGEL